MPLTIDERRHEDDPGDEKTGLAFPQLRAVRLLEVPLQVCDVADGDPANPHQPSSLAGVRPGSVDTAHSAHGLEAAQGLRPDQTLVAGWAGDVRRQIGVRAQG